MLPHQLVINLRKTKHDTFFATVGLYNHRLPFVVYEYSVILFYITYIVHIHDNSYLTDAPRTLYIIMNISIVLNIIHLIKFKAGNQNTIHR